MPAPPDESEPAMVSATGVVIALPAWSSAVASRPYPVPSALSGCQQVPGRYIGRNLPETTAMVPFFVQFKCKLGQSYACLLYTSDAADDLLCVDLGGRRI